MVLDIGPRTAARFAAAIAEAGRLDTAQVLDVQIAEIARVGTAAGWVVRVRRHRPASRDAEIRRNAHAGSGEAPDVPARCKV